MVPVVRIPAVVVAAWADRSDTSFMRTYIDDRLLESSGTTLGESLSAVRAEVEGRLVVEVEADGVPVPPEHLDEPPTTSPYAQELRIRTAPPGPLVAEALMQVAEAIEETRGEHEAVAELIQGGEVEQGLDRLRALLAVWQRTQELIDLSLQTPGVNLNESQRLGESAEELVDRLNELKRSLGVRDWSSASDVLLYDMPEMIGRWGVMLRESARDLAGPGGS